MHVVVRDGGRGRFLVERQAIEAAAQDRIHVAIGARTRLERPGAGSIEPHAAVALLEPQDAQARAIALLWVWTTVQNRPDQRLHVSADLAGPGNQARGRPLQVFLMRLGHVARLGRMTLGRMAAQMRGHTLALVEELDREGREAHVHLLVHERMRRRVEGLGDFDVVVNVDARRSPGRVHERLDGQRTKIRPIEFLEELPARLAAVTLHMGGR